MQSLGLSAWRPFGIYRRLKSTNIIMLIKNSGKKKLLALVACLFLSWNTYAQNQTISPLNLSFEETENNLPKGWYISGSPSYKANIDTKIVQNGRNALLIEGNGGYKIITLGLPHNYTEKKLLFPDILKPKIFRTDRLHFGCV